MTTTARKKNPNWTRERVCVECSRVEFVRKDNTSTRCKSCAAKGNARSWVVRMVANAAERATYCPVCGSKKRKLDSYCSVACRKTITNVDRICKCCGKTFKVTRSSLSGKTNASRNFCSRPCYEKHMCRTERVTGRGSRWARIRRVVLRKWRFCAWCGTLNLRRLQVHHIVPFRLTFDNSEDNLIPLCLRCHKCVESAVHNVEALGLEPNNIGDIFKIILRGRQGATRGFLTRLCNES